MELTIGGVTRTRIEHALCRTIAEGARCYGDDTAFDWVGLLCRYGAVHATLRLAQVGAVGITPFGSVTDLTTGRERPVSVHSDANHWFITGQRSPPRTLLRLYWPLA